MRHFFSRTEPSFSRVLLVESGSRAVLEELIPGLYETYGDRIQVDVVTCYAGSPAGLSPSSRIFRVGDYAGGAGRKRLYRELRANGYKVGGILCSGEPIMTKWKWALTANLPVKVFVLNENGDHFWLDRFHTKTMWQFVLYRAGLSGAGAVGTLARLAFFPFTLLYLLLYAATVHSKRQIRKLVRA